MDRPRRKQQGLVFLLASLLMLAVCWPARGDLIRPKTSRMYPDIAGDIVGFQNYTYDPATRTGTFQVVNSPQFIAVGPRNNDLLSVTPDPEGTLRQTLELKLDQNGRLVETAENRFQLFGSVVIDNVVYKGLLLEGKPTAFGAQAQQPAAITSTDAFDLNMTITGGKLAWSFGREAYFRVIPQSNSTFQGSFETSFSSDKPLTNLRALQGTLPAPVPEPGALVVFLTGGIAALSVRRLKRARMNKRRPREDQSSTSRKANLAE